MSERIIVELDPKSQTPGPWMAVDRVFEEDRIFIMDRSHVVIASIYVEGDTSQQDKANATVLAMAPSIQKRLVMIEVVARTLLATLDTVDSPMPRMGGGKQAIADLERYKSAVGLLKHAMSLPLEGG